MKEYPSITKNINHGLDYYAFDKKDGNNIRAEWSRKRSFYKFGTRHAMMDEFDKNNPYVEAVSLIRNFYEEDLGRIFKELRTERAVCYFEYCGPNSFAGQHNFTDPMEVILFDVDLFKQGILMPDQFLKLFDHLKIPELLYHGKINQPFIQSVKESTLPGMTFEGVVCKAKNPKKTLMPIMCKVKSQAWLNKLKEFCKDDEELYRKLE